jgi:ABC-type antimicrobial peptide transport system permease subunit
VATLEDVRAEVLSPDRVNAFVFSGFAGIALLIAVVGIAGVLAFSVSARTREFGVRLAVGSEPRRLVSAVLAEGVTMAAIGVAGGAVGGYALARVAAHLLDDVVLPGMMPVIGASTLLIVAATVASLVPAARAGRVDVLRALQSE